VFIDLAEFQAGEHTTRLEDPVRLSQRGRDIAKVADAKRDGVEVDAVVGDGRGRGDGRVGGEGLGAG